MVPASNRSRGEPRVGLEIELKFELSQRDVRTLCGSAVLKAMQCEPLRRKAMRATYFDTANLDMSARGVSLRVRKESRRYVQCVKAAAADTKSGGGFARREWEWPVKPTLVESSGFDAALLRADDELKPLFKGIAVKKLQPIFTTDITRQTRVLVTPGGARIKCDIDQGRILSGDREAPIYELELELVSGNVSELLELARLVTQTVPARLSSRTKAYRGMTLFLNQGHVWARAEPLAFPKTASAEDVLHASMLEGLKHLLRNEDCVLTRCDSEGVHQMRIAMRRMRSLITTYKALLPVGSYETLAEQLQQAAGELGPARDWDVFIDELLPPVQASYPGSAELVELRRRAELRRTAGYKRADRLIHSPDYAGLLTDVLYWAGNRAWRGEDVEQTPGVERLGEAATHVASEVLAHRYRQLLKAGKGLKDQTIEQRHQLRIAIKKARYAAEFFKPIYPAKKATAYIRALRDLQDGLGHLNDLANAQPMMAELIGAARGAKVNKLTFAAGLVEGWYTHAQVAKEHDLLAAWKAFTKVKGFW